MKALVVKTSYCIELDVKEFLAAWKAENADEDGKDSLVVCLTKIEGVVDVNYDPHFGAAVFYAVEQDAPSFAQAQVKTEINKWLARGKKGKK